MEKQSKKDLNIMYKRILVPTDGTPMSEKAVEGAARFAKSLGASLVLITVVEPYSYTNLSEYRPESIEQYDERVTAEAKDLEVKAAEPGLWDDPENAQKVTSKLSAVQSQLKRLASADQRIEDALSALMPSARA